MQTGWIVYPTTTKHSSFGNNAFGWMQQTAQKFDIALRVLFREQLQMTSDFQQPFRYQGAALAVPDFVIIRDYDAVLSMQCELQGIRTINSYQAMRLAQNKMLTSQLLKRHNIATPDYYYSLSASYQEVADYFGNSRFVAKALVGSKGESVFLVTNQNEFEAALAELAEDYYFQAFIAESSGADIRVYAIGDRVVGAVKRTAKSGFKSNYSLGGTVEHCPLNPALIALSRQAAACLGLEFCGIDLLLLSDGTYTVCEVNGNAGFRTMTAVSDIDIVHELFAYIRATS